MRVYVHLSERGVTRLRVVEYIWMRVQNGLALTRDRLSRPKVWT